MRTSIFIGLLAAVAALASLIATPAGAHPKGFNGQIVFSRTGPDAALWTVNPDGSHLQRLALHPPLAGELDNPTWSPDGTQIATSGNPEGGASVVINVDDGSWHNVPSDPTLNNACGVWSPDGERLACGQFAPADPPSRNGVYTVRASDGGDPERVTTNPGGHDEAGDFSPDGKRLVFFRDDANGDHLGLFITHVDGHGLKQIAGPLASSEGRWSPQGNEIAFSRHVTSDFHSSLWVIHANGTGLHQIKVKGLACGGNNDDPNWIACGGPAWSPDGRKLVFGTATATSSAVYTVNVDGTGLTELVTGGPGELNSPDWGTHPLAR